MQTNLRQTAAAHAPIRSASACGEPPPERQRERPWYYHYLIARELSKHGDSLGAVARLAQALRKRDDPSETARTYGMKVIAYRPSSDA